MAIGDVVVKRVEGANVNIPINPPSFKLCVIGRSRGKATENSNTYERSDTTTDSLATVSFKDEIARSIEKIISRYGNTYYPGIDFLVKKGSVIVDYKNIPDYKFSELTIDWNTGSVIRGANIEIYQTYTDGGSLPDNTEFTFYVCSVNENDEESLPGTPLTIKSPNTGSNSGRIFISWKRVEGAKEYHIYINEKGTNNWYRDPITTNDYVVVTETNYIFSDFSFEEFVPTIPTNPVSKIPEDNSNVALYYTYSYFEYDTPKEYTSYDEVIADHGIGSEVSNFARFVLTPEFVNAGRLVIVVPKNNPSNDKPGLTQYLEALDTLKNYDVQFITVLYAGTDVPATFITNMQPIYNHCASLSNPITGQRERRMVFGPVNGMVKSDIESILSAFQNFDDNGNRAIFVVPDGSYCKLQSWQNIDGSYTYNTTVTDSDGYDITPMVVSGITVAKYLSLGDLAMPLTNKNVPGIVFDSKRKYTDEEIKDIRSKGACVLENKNNIAVVSLGILMGYPVSGLEDSSLNIASVEDFMKMDLRHALDTKDVRGQKALPTILSYVKNGIVTKKLAQYVSVRLITAYDPNSIKVYMDPEEPNKLRIFFRYMPVYSIDKVWAEFDYFLINLQV